MAVRAGGRFLGRAGPRLLALIVLLLLCALKTFDAPPFPRLEAMTLDTWQRLYPREQVGPPVMVVDIDEQSLAAHGQWPWGRDLVADLLTNVDRAGARGLAFDIIFSEPDRLSPRRFSQRADLPEQVMQSLQALPDTDEALASRISELSLPIVLGEAASAQNLNRLRNGAEVSERPPSPFVIIKPGRGAVMDPMHFIPGFRDILRNLSVLEQAANGIGMVVLVPEPDGVVRRVPAMVRIGQDYFPSLAVELWRVAAEGAGSPLIRMDRSGYGVAEVKLGSVKLPVARDGRLHVWFRNFIPPGAGGTRYVSAADVLAGDPDALMALKDRFVLVGTSAIGLEDIRLTSMGDRAPGVEVHANVLEMILAGQFRDRPGALHHAENVAMLILGLLVIYAWRRIGATRGLIGVIVAYCLILIAGRYALLELNVLVDISGPLLALGASTLIMAVGGYLESDAEKRQISSAFSRYLSPDLVDQLAADPSALKLGGEARELSILFTDIASFTSMSEKLSPAELGELLNDYLTGMCGIIQEAGGTIDKLIGDAIVAFFNAPLSQPDHAARAVRCAIALDDHAEAFRAACLEKHGVEIGITRIGGHMGEATVGNFGGESRFDYTALGDSMNTAARLESINSQLGTRLCLSADLVQAAEANPTELGLREVGGLVLKGRTTALPVFTRQVDGMLSEKEWTRILAGIRAETLELEELKRLSDEYLSDPLLDVYIRHGQNKRPPKILAFSSK
ncbi:MAG: adenylate/guanylate cyclase domain-containing protein [Alphaproteobacteria bacterium]